MRVGVLEFQLPNPPETWGPAFEVVTRNVAWAGGNVLLFWPMDDRQLWLAVAIPADSKFDPEARIRDELGARASTSRWVETDVPEPDPDDEEAAWSALAFRLAYPSAEIRHAAPWPRGRCALCGAERPPHHPTCPYRTR